ncbi:hypothetical protein D3C76_1693610 [compost metagenome]
MAAFVGERISVNAFRVQAFFFSCLVKTGRVIPTGRTGFAFAARLFKKYADSGRTAAEGGIDT